MHTPLAKTNDPISSHAAGYKFANSEVLKNHEAIILDLLRRFPNRTSKQLAAIELEESGEHALDRIQIARRLAGMKSKGLIDCTPKSVKGERQWWAVKHV